MVVIVSRFCERIKIGNRYNLVILNVIFIIEKIIDVFRLVFVCVIKELCKLLILI